MGRRMATPNVLPDCRAKIQKGVVRLGDLNWQGAESFIRSMERGKLPLERELITPVGLTKGDDLVRVFTNRG